MAKKQKTHKTQLSETTKKHYHTISQAMISVFRTENFDTVHSDETMANELQKKGIWATSTMVRNVRLLNKFPSRYERKAKLFSAK